MVTDIERRWAGQITDVLSRLLDDCGSGGDADKLRRALAEMQRETERDEVEAGR